MAVYAPIIPNVPPWVHDRIEVMGLAPAAASFRALAASATTAGDTTNATFFSALNTAIQHSLNYPGRTAGSATFITIRKA
jgi:hypothetical protein